MPATDAPVKDLFNAREQALGRMKSLDERRENMKTGVGR
jgi:hypothetical protein